MGREVWVTVVVVLVAAVIGVYWSKNSELDMCRNSCRDVTQRLEKAYTDVVSSIYTLVRLRALFIGSAGVGKSTLIKNLVQSLGHTPPSSLKTGAEVDPVTMKPRTYEANWVDHQRHIIDDFSVVDTRGFSDTYSNDTMISEDIMQHLRPHGIWIQFLVLVFKHDRMLASSRDASLKVLDAFDDYQHLLIVLTHCKDMSDEGWGSFKTTVKGFLAQKSNERAEYFRLCDFEASKEAYNKELMQKFIKALVEAE